MHVFRKVTHQLANAWCQIRVRNNLEQIVRRRHQLFGFYVGIHRRVLKAQRAISHADRTVIQRTHERITFNRELWLRQLFREAPEFATTRGWCFVIQIQIVAVAGGFTILIDDGQDLAAFRVIAKTGRVRHADKFVIDDRVLERQRFWHSLAESFRIRAVADDQKLTIKHLVRALGKSRAQVRHAIRVLTDFFDFHVFISSWGNCFGA